MARVEWTRQSGEDVETVIGMLLCSRHPNAVRVRPSQGDGGIDIFVPGPAGFGAERAVYQVKKYCENLTASQKRKIKASFKTVVGTSTREGWRITEWHLVMQLDLTDRDLGWLDEMVADADFPCETNGLLFCDTLAAHYPKVVDYYLRDGKQRLQAEMDNLTRILSRRVERDDNDAITPAAVLPDLVSIYQALNSCDPFYKYSYAVSDTPPQDQPGPGEDGLVAVWGVERDAVWIVIKIFALSQASLIERPIAGQFTMNVPDDDPTLQEQVRNFFVYGTPLTLPEGTVGGFLDLPAGLGGELTGASLQVLPIPEEVDAEQTILTIAMLPPDSDAAIASTTILRTNYGTGIQGGHRSTWTDYAKLFTIEMRAKDGHATMNLTVGYDLAGRRPSEILSSLQFLAAMSSPNRIALTQPYGPPQYTTAAETPHERDSDTQRWATVADALNRIQDHVPNLLKMPREMSGEEAAEIIEAAELPDGEAISGRLTRPFTVHHSGEHALNPALTRNPGTTYEFCAIKSILIALDSEIISVGKQALFVLGHYSDIGEESSRITPVSDGISFRYTGAIEAGRVLARNFAGTVDISATQTRHQTRNSD